MTKTQQVTRDARIARVAKGTSDAITTFPDGSIIRQLSERSYQEVDLLGRHVRYGRVEHASFEHSNAAEPK